MDLWLKAFHIIAVIAWMAGLLYLPRLFVYHADSPAASPQSEIFKAMERRLLRAIMTPAMLASWMLGLWMAWRGAWFVSGWFLAKFVLVVALSGFHGYLAKQVKVFAADANRRSAIHFRVINEIPTLLMVAIVLLAVLKPF